MQIRDRIKEFRRVRAGDLRPNPKNWRTHPDSQRDALKGILAEVGYADALIAQELPEGGLELIDGHLRAETTPDMEVPVLVLDVDEAEANKILATLDPLSAMAEANAAQLDGLLREVQTGNEALLEMLAETASKVGLYKLSAKENNQEGHVTPEDVWQGMPEFEQEDFKEYKAIVVRFLNEEDYKAFSTLVAQNLTTNTKSIWFPKQDFDQLNRDNRYTTEQ